MQKSDIEERTESERDFTASNGPARPGFLTEAALAARWGRSVNTLVGWRTRPHASFQPLAFEWCNRSVYYRHDVITAYESDPRNARIRPAAQRGTPLPPLEVEKASVPPMDVQAELPLQLSAGEIEHVMARGFQQITISAGYALAIAEDGSAWFASVLGGLDMLTWKPVQPLPLGPCISYRTTTQAVAA